jgi:hypothetical protein
MARIHGQEVKKTVDEAKASKAIAADTAKKGRWKIGGTAALSYAQQNSSYWVGSSEDFSLNIGAAVAMYANEEWKNHTWENTFKASYAANRTGSQGYRKTADFFDLYSKRGHYLNKHKTLAASIIFNLRSQFLDGYDYTQDPRRRVSDFFAPANLLLTPGLDWRPNKHFSLFVSPVAAKWVFVTNDPYSYSYPGGTLPDGSQQQPIAELYGVDPERKVDAQFGAFVSLNFEKEILKNVNYTSRLDFYTNYLHEPQNIDIFWTNTLGFKVNKWLTFTYQWNVVYDDDYVPEGLKGPRTQFLGNLGIGTSVNF